MQRRPAALALFVLLCVPAAPASGQETRFVHAQRFRRAEGLGGAIAVALSPDGRNLYATGFTDHSLVVLQRDPVSGALTWLQTVFDGAPSEAGGERGGTPADGLANAARVVVSPDGAHLYTAGWGDAAIGIFQRLADGTVAYLDALADPGLDGVSDLAVSGDGALLFSTSYVADRVTAWSRDPGTGALTYLDHYTHPNMDEPRALQVAPNGNRAWVVSKAGDSLFILDFSPAGGFTPAGAAIGGPDLDGAYDLVVTAEGTRIYVAAFDGDLVSYFRHDAAGLQFVDSFGAPELDAPAGLWSDGSRLWVSSTDAGWLLELDLDLATGLMTLDGMHGVIGALSPAGLTGSVADGHLYVAALGGAVGAFRTSPLEPIASVEGTPEIADPISLALAPDGAYLYLGTGGGAAEGIAWLRRDPATGGTYNPGWPSIGSSEEARIALAPDGAHLYAARRPSQEIEVWERLAGGLFLIDVVPASASPSTEDVEAMAFSPGGDHLYLGGQPGLLAVWPRQADGTVAFLESHALAAPIADLAVTPDGGNVYAVTGSPGSLHAFDRDAVTGALTPLSPGSPVSPPFTALDAAPGSEWLYAVRDHEIVAFRRGASGHLMAEQVVDGGAGGAVPEMVSPADVAVSPDGRTVWVLAGDPLAGDPDALIVFFRSPANGRLTWLETRFADEPGIRGLDGPSRLAVAADGDTVSVLSRGLLQADHSVAVFRAAQPIFVDGFESGDTGAWSLAVP